MKKLIFSSLFVNLSLVFGLLCLNLSVSGQDQSKLSAALPENVNKIFSFSCMPCHSSTGGLMSRTKLNFTEWTQYSSEKQKVKAGKIYSELKKGDMPPKTARENRPDIIPTKEQIGTIKIWSESFKSEAK